MRRVMKGGDGETPESGNPGGVSLRPDNVGNAVVSGRSLTPPFTLSPTSIGCGLGAIEKLETNFYCSD
jgi:hypothetical protein